MKFKSLFLYFYTLCAALSPAFLTAADSSKDNAPKESQSHQPVDFILATVGDDILLFSDLQKTISMTSQGKAQISATGVLSGSGVSVEQAQQVLNSLIDQKVLAQKVHELGLQATDEELQVEVNNQLKSQNMTQEKLFEALKAEGVSYESYQEEFKRQLETSRLIGRMIRPTLSATDDEVRSFYLQQPGIAEKQKRIKLRSLVLNFPSTLSEAQLAERKSNLEKLEKEIRQSSNTPDFNFEKLIRLYSNDPDAIKGGELAPKEIKDLPPQLQEKLKNSVAPGTVLDPINIGSSVFFFQYLGTILNNESEFEKQKDYWKNMLFQTKSNEKLSEYLSAERQRTKIKQKPFVIKKD